MEHITMSMFIIVYLLLGHLEVELCKRNLTELAFEFIEILKINEHVSQKSSTDQMYFCKTLVYKYEVNREVSDIIYDINFIETFKREQCKIDHEEEQK